MAEDRLFNRIGGEEEADAAETEGPAPLDPGAAALAMQAAQHDAVLAGKAGAYFDTQARLVGIQSEHLHEQREVLLSHLKVKRLSERLRVGTQFFFAIVAGLFVAYLVVMLHDAVVSRAVIVEPFDAPAVLDAGGHSGRVLASMLLDQLTRMQAATQATAAKRGLANSWSNDIKVEVPETGLSLGDIDRLLRARLGHDLHIGGDLVQADGGTLVLTVRGDGVLPKSFAGPVAGLDRLFVQAGEYVYGQTQPSLYAVYLLHAGRNAEAIGFCRDAVLTAPVEERAYLYNAWAGSLANSGGSLQQGLALERAALALKPDFWAAYENAALDATELGDEEGAWRLGRQMLRAAGGRPGAAPEVAYAPLDFLTQNWLVARRAAIADAEQHAGIGSKDWAANPVIAALDVGLHDWTDARLRLESFDLSDPYAAGIAHYVRSRLAADAGDTATALREMQLWGAANADPAVSGGDISFHCDVAQSQEAAGQSALADASLRAGGHSVDCFRFRADFLDRRGDWSAAQSAYAAAVAVAPDLPAAYESWGRALARHQDWAGAIARLSAAHARGSHWADPLKDWGDVLARQGQRAAAAAKYDAALRDAPEWQQLHAARQGLGE